MTTTRRSATAATSSKLRVAARQSSTSWYDTQQSRPVVRYTRRYQHGTRGEPRRAPQPSSRDAQVHPGTFQDREPARLVHRLSCRDTTAEADRGETAGLGEGVALPLDQDGPQADDAAAPAAGHFASPPAGASTRPITADNRAQ